MSMNIPSEAELARAERWVAVQRAQLEIAEAQAQADMAEAERISAASFCKMPAQDVYFAYRAVGEPRQLNMAQTLQNVHVMRGGKLSEHAAQQWGKFKAAMLARSCGMTGFREYLPDFAGKWTPDSGPIVAGIGVAASALAIKAAGAIGDTEVQRDLITSAGRAARVLRTIGQIPGADRFTRLATDLLASSIYLSGSTTRTRINQTALAA